MVIEFLLSMVAGLFSGVAGLLGNAQAPGWLVNLGGPLESLTAYAETVGVWVPWSTFTAVCGAVLACFGISFAIRLVRIVLSLLTGGGGSAA